MTSGLIQRAMPRVSPSYDRHRLPLYTAKLTDDERVFWVDAGLDGELTHGEGRPEWASVTPRCPGTVQ